MTAAPEPTPLPKLEDDPRFRDWMVYVRARKDVGELHDKRAIEAQKLSADFSKLIITNLHFINAGGLGAVPTLASTLLGFAGLSRVDKLFYMGIPMGLFASGLICASLCAFETYRNFAAAAAVNEFDRNILIFDLEAAAPLFPPDHQAKCLNNKSIYEKAKKGAPSKLFSTFWTAYTAGWGSILSFISACAFLAWNIR